MLQYALALDVIQVLDGSWELFSNLANVNAVPCMFTGTLSLSDSEDVTG